MAKRPPSRASTDAPSDGVNVDVRLHADVDKILGRLEKLVDRIVKPINDWRAKKESIRKLAAAFGALAGSKEAVAKGVEDGLAKDSDVQQLELDTSNVAEHVKDLDSKFASENPELVRDLNSTVGQKGMQLRALIDDPSRLEDRLSVARMLKKEAKKLSTLQEKLLAALR